MGAVGCQDVPVRSANVLAPVFDLRSNRDGYRWRCAQMGRSIGAAQIRGNLYVLEEGQRSSPYHFHHGIEEWLLVVEGEPLVRTPDGERELAAGDVLCFPRGAGRRPCR